MIPINRTDLDRLRSDIKAEFATLREELTTAIIYLKEELQSIAKEMEKIEKKSKEKSG